MKPISVAIYARYSTDRQDARSIDDQIRRCRAFSSDRGFEVVAEYKDQAQSGAHLDRADMQRMLKDAHQRGGAPFKAILVDDLSRLSRDLGNTWRIVFEDLFAVSVKVIDVNTGMASDGAGARLAFGAMALVNDTFLELVRTETQRGLEGRALAGFWTGGKVYGYRTIVEPNPTDPEHPRKLPVKDDGEAVVVRRIFDMLLEGHGFKKIAAILNEEGVPAPYDGQKANKKHGRGWGHTTVRAMLMNERYAGTWTWNKRKFVRVPGKKNRRAVLRPEHEWTRTEHPELAIITKDLWAKAQTKFRRAVGAKGTRGRPPGAGKFTYLVSGLLRCGSCGGSMGVIGARMKEGTRYATFGCLTNNTRGDAICANALTISEKKITAAVVAALRDTLLQKDLVQRFTMQFNRRVRDLQKSRKKTDEARDIDAEIASAEQRLCNVTNGLAKLGWSDALAAQLQQEEAQLRGLRDRKSAAEAPERQGAQVLPHPKVLERRLHDLLATLEKDPARGRDLLVRHLGAVVLTPSLSPRGREYVANGAFDLAATIPAGKGAPPGAVLENGDSAPPQLEGPGRSKELPGPSPMGDSPDRRPDFRAGQSHLVEA